ncbi:MAG: phenylacetate-CoA oxygenase subunit PaaJ [Salibacteraceae bacterium]
MRAGDERIRKAWEVLREVQDPEIPVISVVDLGIVRSIENDAGTLVVSLTPTYSGCPATKVIEESVDQALNEAGLQPFRILTVLDPPWSTAMISEEGKQKLKAYGIAPPEEESLDKRALSGETHAVSCPRCGSDHTRMVSQFGSTPCKAHFKCLDCLEPFDYFKCL